jgi:predicted RNA-binding protein with EMAP domain
MAATETVEECFCETCDSLQQVENVEGSADMVFCLACGEEFERKKNSSSVYANYCCGEVMQVEPIPKQKDLKKVMVDVKGEGSEKWLQIVTNAKYIEVGWKVVVALENAVVPAGANEDENPEAIRVKPRAVGGVMSNGMLCDCPMLGWVGGAKGALQQLPQEYVVGDEPPSSRPRK